MHDLNSIDPNIKFTYKFSHENIEFLDVLVKKNKDNFLTTDLFYKETDSHQFLHFDSCHPYHTKKGIPYGQALRIKRICSETNDFERRASDLNKWLTSRGHDVNLVKTQIEKARNLDRNALLDDVYSKINQENKLFLVVTFHPALTKRIYEILKSNHNILTASDEQHKKIFSDVPSVSFRRCKTIKDILVRSKLRLEQFQMGSSNRCNRKNCLVDKSLDTNKFFVNFDGKRTFNLRKGHLDCNSKFVVYKIKCLTCNLQYVGSTVTKFRERFNNYKAQFRKFLKRKEEGHKNPGDGISQAKFFSHFCEPNHKGIDDWSFQLIDQSDNLERLRKRESFWQHKLNSFIPNGLNQREVLL